jgi:hypothetical protein
LRNLRTDSDAAQAQAHLQEASRAVADGKNLIAETTGGTKTAFTIPASLQAIDSRRSPLFEPKQGVDFFTGQYADDLRPIDIAIDGQRRTVMASAESIEALQRGESPQVAGRNVNGRFTPWYGDPDYTPGYGRGYGFGGGGGSMLGDLLMFSAVSSIFNPFRGGSHQSYQSGFADGARSAGSNQDSSNDNGGFDFGGGNDFDSGGSFDFGGGGDFGGGDFGGDGGGGFD